MYEQKKERVEQRYNRVLLLLYICQPFIKGSSLRRCIIHCSTAILESYMLKERYQRNKSSPSLSNHQRTSLLFLLSSSPLQRCIPLPLLHRLKPHLSTPKSNSHRQRFYIKQNAMISMFKTRFPDGQKCFNRMHGCCCISMLDLCYLPMDLPSLPCGNSLLCMFAC